MFQNIFLLHKIYNCICYWKLVDFCVAHFLSMSKHCCLKTSCPMFFTCHLPFLFYVNVILKMMLLGLHEVCSRILFLFFWVFLRYAAKLEISSRTAYINCGYILLMALLLFYLYNALFLLLNLAGDCI